MSQSAPSSMKIRWARLAAMTFIFTILSRVWSRGTRLMARWRLLITLFHPQDGSESDAGVNVVEFLREKCVCDGLALLQVAYVFEPD